jgi:D-alanine transaminase
MSRIAYVNGRYVPHDLASVHIEDRGYQFADGVYEVVAIQNGALVDEIPHLDRLDRSLRELAMDAPMARAPLRHVLREVIRRNRVRTGIVYLQITRGVAPRDHAYPKHATPALVVTARSQAPKAGPRKKGVSVVTAPDIRWQRKDIKSVSLLPNVMAKQAASERGAYEAWLVLEDGTVTEGTATNAWIVLDGKTLVTHGADWAILNGVTRQTVIGLAKDAGYTVEERQFRVQEALGAAECFLTSTTSWVMPVISIDGSAIADGKPGPLTRLLQDHYDRYLASL